VADSEPTVKGIKPNKPIPIKQKNKFIELIKSLKEILFGNNERKPTYKKRSRNYNPNYKGKKFNKNYKPRNNRYGKNKNYNKKD